MILTIDNITYRLRFGYEVHGERKRTRRLTSCFIEQALVMDTARRGTRDDSPDEKTGHPRWEVLHVATVTHNPIDVYSREAGRRAAMLKVLNLAYPGKDGRAMRKRFADAYEHRFPEHHELFLTPAELVTLACLVRHHRDTLTGLDADGYSPEGDDLERLLTKLQRFMPPTRQERGEDAALGT